MLVKRSALVLGLAVSLDACGGGGGSGSSTGTIPGGTGGGTAPQTKYVTPTFTFVLPKRAGSTTAAATNRRAPAYISPGANGVTITLIVEGQPNVSVTTDLDAPGVCTTTTPTTCTVNGPAIPPGTDQLQVTLYDTEPIAASPGAPLTEPQGASILAQSSSSASPVTPDPTYTISPGAGQQLSVTLFGVPRFLNVSEMDHLQARNRNAQPPVRAFAASPSPPLVTVPQGGTFNANTQNQQGPIHVDVSDFSDDSISGQYSEPVTLTDNDVRIGKPGGAYATGVACCGSTTGAASVTLNSSNDLSSLVMTYGGLDEDAPTVTLSATGAQSDQETPFSVDTDPIVVSGSEVDLFAPSGPGSTGAFTIQEAGWSNPPYAQNFTSVEDGCTSGTVAATYSLAFGSPDPSGVVTVTDTAPSNAAAGFCSIILSSYDSAAASAKESFSYTSGSIGIDARKRTR